MTRRLTSILAALALLALGATADAQLFPNPNAPPVPTGGGSSSCSGDINSGCSSVLGVDGVTYPASPSTNTVPVVTGTNTVTYEVAPAAAGGTGSSSVPSAGQLPVGNAGGTAYAAVTIGGDCTLTSAGVLTCTKTNGTAFGTAATQNTGTSGATLPFLNGANTWGGVQTFTNSDLALLGSSTGKTTFTSANAGASNFTLTVPAVTDTMAVLGTFAAPPAIGNTTAAAGSFTTLSATGAATFGSTGQSSIAANGTPTFAGAGTTSLGANGWQWASSTFGMSEGDTSADGWFNPPGSSGSAENRWIRVSPATLTITASYATQRFFVHDQNTITAGSALSVSTEADTDSITGPPIAAGSATLAAAYGLHVAPGATVAGGGTVTKAVGFRVDVPTGGTANKAAEINGHMEFTGTAPGVTAGTSPSIVGNDHIGRVTVGTSPGTTVALTFNASWTNAPACFAQDETSAVTMRATTVSVSAVTFTASSTLTAADKVSYRCEGYF